MAKRSRRALSKKGLVGLKRVVNEYGVKVWQYKGKELETLRQVVTMFKLDQLGITW